MADKYLSYQSQLQLQTVASPPTYTEIASVMSISGPSMTRTVVDNTTFDALNNFRTRQFGMRDGAEVTLEIVFDPDEPTHDDTVNGLFDLYNDDANPLRNWRLAISNSGKGFEFAAAVTGFDFNLAGVDDNVMATITLSVSGPVSIETFARV